MPFGTSLGSALGIVPRKKSSSSVNTSPSTIKVGNVPKEKSHFNGLGPSEPLVMATKQATPDMQPKLGMYPGNQGTGGGSNASGTTRNTRSQGLPAGMPPDLGMSAGPYAQPAMPQVDPNMMMGMMGGGQMGGGMGQQGPPQPPAGLGPSVDPLMKRRMMTSRPGSY